MEILNLTKASKIEKLDLMNKLKHVLRMVKNRLSKQRRT